MASRAVWNYSPAGRPVGYVSTLSAVLAAGRNGRTDGGHPLLFLPNPERRVELAVVFDGKQMLTFDGGKLIDRGPASDYKPENVTRTFKMADQGFVGRMHQVRISSVARYKADYKPVRRFTPDKDTIALYRFDEGKGDKLTDYSGNNHHGKIVGGTWLKSFTTPYWTPTLDQLLALNSIISQEGHDAVTHKLREVNHGTCDIEFEPKEGPPKRCVIKSVATHTIWPLAALPSITSLDLSATSVSDFTPLTALPLVDLKASIIVDNVQSEQALQSVAPLKTLNGKPVAEVWKERTAARKEIDNQAPILATLSLEERQIWFASAIKKLNPHVAAPKPHLEKKDGLMCLHMGEGHFIDYSPVRALDVEYVDSSGSWCCDLTPFAKTRVQELLFLNGSRIHDLRPLAQLPLKKLRVSGSYIDDLSPLRDLKLEVCDYGAENTHVKDVSVLSSMPLKSLYVPAPVDLKPFANMKLEHLHLGGTADLRPIAAMKLKSLVVGTLEPIDLAPVKGMPLESLKAPRVIDISAFEGAPLKDLVGSFRLYSESDEKVIRSLPLKTMNKMPIEEFWKRVAAQRKADADATAELAKAPLQQDALSKAIGKAMGSRVANDAKIADGAVTELAIQVGAPLNLAPLRAFPRLRILRLHQVGPSDMSPLAKLPIEEIECIPTMLTYNAPILRKMPMLKTINGKAAKEVLKAAGK